MRGDEPWARQVVKSSEKFEWFQKSLNCEIA